MIQAKSIFRIGVITILLLLIPLVLNLTLSDFDWSLLDFVVAGILFFLLGISIEIIRKSKLFQKRKTLYIILVIVFFVLVWMELAVGIFNTPFGGN